MLAASATWHGRDRPGQTRDSLGQNHGMDPHSGKRRRWLGAGAMAALLPAAPAAQAQASGATPTRPPLRVGLGQDFAGLAEALRQAQDGDTLEVLPGEYRGDVAVILQRQLRIIGLGEDSGERPWLIADGRAAERKAIWVLRDGDFEIRNIGFRGARVPDQNGAGIRFEKGRLLLQHCHFVDNENGLLSGNDGQAELVILDCEFRQAAPPPSALTHLLYVGRIGSLQVRRSRFLQGREGSLLKSRARQSLIVGNQLDDGLDGEASYQIDLPNGGIAHVEGNLLVQSPRAQNSTLLSFGAEGQAWPDSRLTVLGNTFVNHRTAGGVFIRVWANRLPLDAPVRSSGNRLLGPGSLVLGPQGQSDQDQRGPLPAPPPPSAAAPPAATAATRD